MMVVTSDNLTPIIFRLPQEDLEAFDAVARERRTSRAALLRESVLETTKKYRRIQRRENQ